MLPSLIPCALFAYRNAPFIIAFHGPSTIIRKVLSIIMEVTLWDPNTLDSLNDISP
jgi:hypothetical protein